MPPKKRGFKFTTRELESLAEAVADMIPMSNTDWDNISEIHDANFPGLNRTSDSLKRKFQEMARTKIPTGDPNCPLHIRIAKRAYYKLVKSLDGSTGGGSGELDLGLEDEASEGGEGVGEFFSDNDEDNPPGIQEIVVLDRHDEGPDDRDEGGGTSLGLDPTNLFAEMPGNNDSFGDCGGADDLLAAASATASTAASTSLASTSAASARGKHLSSVSTAESAKKKSRAITKPLRIARKSPSNSSDADGEGDGWSFGNMMHMMMMQGRLDNERREQQNKNEADQREREYQLRREEMALAREEEAREQRQMMNLMFMAMLNKNAGSDSNPHPPSPSKP
jgi:hypothetical protein